LIKLSVGDRTVGLLLSPDNVFDICEVCFEPLIQLDYVLIIIRVFCGLAKRFKRLL
jgi:hypothetical protein